MSISNRIANRTKGISKTLCLLVVAAGTQLFSGGFYETEVNAQAGGASNWLRGAVRGDPREKLKSLVSQCMKRDATACIQAGSIYLVASRGEGIGKDNARKLFRAGCQMGDDRGCSLLRQMKKFDFEMRKLSRECESGNAKSCLTLGAIYERGAKPIMESDKKKAIYMLHRACELGVTQACGSVAQSIAYELKNAKNFKVGEGLMEIGLKDAEKGCEKLDGTSCLMKGILLLSGGTVSKKFYNPAFALSPLKKACMLQKKGSGDLACYLLGSVYEQGIPDAGIPKSIKKASVYYMKACVTGNKKSCEKLNFFKKSKKQPKAQQKKEESPITYEMKRGITPEQAYRVQKMYDAKMKKDAEKTIKQEIKKQMRAEEGEGR